MDASGRHRLIIEQVESVGRVVVTDLAERLDVTPETIRRDLTALDRSGALRKVHGGAVPASALALPETGVSHRERLNTAAKNAIARAALGHLDLAPGTSVLVDAGTTTGALARLLPGDRDLTVLTNSVLIAAHLASRSGLTVRMLGGHVRGLTQAAVGPEALATLSALRVDLALMGTNGISPTHGLSTPDPDEATVKAAMVGAARYVAVLADSTKIGQEHLVSFAALDDVNLIVTDADPPPALSTQLTTTGTEVLLA
ncbi:DeoR/GlpR transcriptional regulator [Actinomyces sp. 2119]|uniref:Lactose phosphotransferase system repressor n=1 Tax=Actinomyces lilanjuaniae TaxID=2321394 RepID=A0ABN5PLM7_9ACTO|nr:MULTISPECIES: DeoR/GlpR family DNA-binding transcription regulator [Actinomyces]AYD89130.1 DeoR/GlpR transcriptional regulator [Actinomyces lilanjuaniae]RJF41908.1 DeoR/GlpR transcriptional regulator [Actinomyces sp. 2119]